VHHNRCDGSRWKVNIRLSLWSEVVTSGQLVGRNSAGVAMRVSRGEELGEEGADRWVSAVSD
jgi:hypothetical protein